MALQHYRGSLLGDTLNQAMQELREQGKLQDEAMESINASFDSVTSDALASAGVLLKGENSALADWYGRTNIKIFGHLNMFRGVDNVWTLLITDAKLKVYPGSEQDISLDALKIIAMQKQ
mmetsp:Transcript_32479/g.78601  ORF Transcript_32479/g.78601 Transcript_32479/m.78601 type:complete len:120 (+) Transcript_32479:35-394(+)